MTPVLETASLTPIISHQHQNQPLTQLLINFSSFYLRNHSQMSFPYLYPHYLWVKQNTIFTSRVNVSYEDTYFQCNLRGASSEHRPMAIQTPLGCGKLKNSNYRGHHFLSLQIF